MLNNTIKGNNAVNTLNGLAGNDVLQGLGGNDTYVVDNTSDKTIEAAGGGIDLVNSAVSLTLAVNVDNSTLMGHGCHQRHRQRTGTTTIKGNAGDNMLNGLAGADTMQGLAGNDIYVVDNVSDKAIEAVSAGTDRVNSAVSFTLGANVENLTLTGAAAISGAGKRWPTSLSATAPITASAAERAWTRCAAVSATTVTSSTTSPIRSWRAPAPAPIALSVP